MTNEKDGRNAQPPIGNSNWEIYHNWKFHDFIFHRFLENGKAIFEFLNSISHNGKWLFKKYKKKKNTLDISSVNNIY
jgi:hypothetical protein